MKRIQVGHRATVLALVLCSVMATVQASSGPGPQDHSRGRNVVLLVLDQMHPDQWKGARTCPGLKAWQDLGTNFERALGQSDGRAGGSAAILAQGISLTGQVSPLEKLCAEFSNRVLIAPEGSTFFPEASLTQRTKFADEAFAAARVLIETKAEPFFVGLHLRDSSLQFGHSRSEADRATRLSCAIAVFMAWFREQPSFEDSLLIVVGDSALDAISMSRVPLWMSGLGFPRDVNEGQMGVAQIDVMPTIFDFLGWGWPGSQGRSLYDLMENRPERDLVCASEALNLPEDFHPDVGTIPRELQATEEIVLQRGRFKVVHDRSLDLWSLFDDLGDPDGARDLSKEKPELLRQMKGRLEHWMRLQSWSMLRNRLN